MNQPFHIRRAEPADYPALGRLTVSVYENLPGMPGTDEQPDYYAMLRNVAARAGTPTVEIWVASGPANQVLGGVTFVGDMRHYNSGGSAGLQTNASGIRLLAVDPGARRMGVGRALTQTCIRSTADLGNSRVLLHTTRSMKVAWRMYETMGFTRLPDLDFRQGSLDVFGFMLETDAREPGVKT